MDWKSIISGVVGAVVTAIVFWLFGLVSIYIGQFPIPKHAVVALVEKECPIGWTPYTRGEGRYVVGLNPKGELEGEVGFKLKDHDNFSAGRHTHPYYDHAVGVPLHLSR